MNKTLLKQTISALEQSLAAHKYELELLEKNETVKPKRNLKNERLQKYKTSIISGRYDK